MIKDIETQELIRIKNTFNTLLKDIENNFEEELVETHGLLVETIVTIDQELIARKRKKDENI